MDLRISTKSSRLAWLGLAVCLIAGTADAQSLAPRVKVVVEKDNTAVLAALRDDGIPPLADRGRYLVFDVPTAQLPDTATGLRLRPDFDRVQLRRGVVATQVPRTIGSRILPKPRGDRRLKLIQFAAPPVDADLQLLDALGARIVQYIPENAFVVWTDDATSARALESRIRQAPLVQYLEDYDPQDALSPRLDPFVGRAQAADVIIQFFNDERQSDADLELVKTLARSVGSPGVAVRGRYINLRASISGRDLGDVAALPSVVNIEPYVPPRLFDERQGQIIAGNLDPTKTAPSGPGYLAWLAAKGFPDDPAEFPVIAIVDDGVDDGTLTPVDSEFYLENNAGSPSRVVFATTPPGSATSDAQGPDGHGNINASIIAGYNTSAGSAFEDLLGFNYGLGLVPYGRIGNVRVFTPDFDIGDGHAAMVGDYFTRGTRVSSNSWGADAYGDYDTVAQEYDALTRDAQTGVTGNQQLLFVFAAGNEGPSYTSIGSPATAKNVLSVGASESFDPNASLGTGCGDGLLDGDDARDVADFSSRGPCIDGRMKPDVLAPGTFIHGAASQPVFNGAGVCGAATNDFVSPGTDALFPPGTSYTWSSGTSHATPAISGYAALAHEFLSRTFGVTDPSPALLKAFIVDGSRHITGDGANDALPSPNQGFGLADMGIGFEAGVSRFVHDQQTILGESGAAVTFSGMIPDPSKPVRVALVWTDAPGPTFGDAYANDLNLIVATSVNTYRGNNFSLGLSQPGGTADARNNVEAVVLAPGQSSAATITVEGFAIVADGVPGNVDTTDQDFALVAYNFTDVSPAGTVSLDSSLYSCADAVTVTLRDSDLAGSGTAAVLAATTSGDVETVTLTEGPAGSGIFKQILPTTTGPPTPQDGALQTEHGDLLTATYADADNGNGPAVVEASASVDCLAPTTTGVSTSLGGTYAIVHVEIDEPASVILRYGTACNALTGTVQSTAASQAQDLTIVGLAPLTAHFLRVEVTDVAGNTFIDDNGGSCYTFTTLEPPDYFTEVFSPGEFDLDHHSVTLIPDTSGNHYHACVATTSAFGTDPVGGSVLALSDDSSHRVDIAAGAQVPFYGVPHSTLYVNSNGNLTFDAADTDFTESVLDHFKLPRVAALFDDLDPGSGGTVSWRQLPDHIAVTYENVPRFDQGDVNSFQIELFFDGTIRVTYLGISGGDALVGISEGLGQPLDFLDSDFTAYSACSVSAGRVLLDAPIYTCTDTVTATVEDIDLAGSGAAEVLLSATGGDSESLVLAETPAGSGVFSGSIATSGAGVQLEDGVLQIASAQTITAVYNDLDDGSGSPATRTMGARTLCTDHFTLYKARVSRDGAAFYRFSPLTLSDEFGTVDYDIIRPISLAAPGDKNDEGLNDATTYLQEYKLRLAPGAPRPTKVSDLRAINQCGDAYVQTMQPVSLLVPAHVDVSAPVAAPLSSEHRLDHFLCYRAKALKKLSDGTRVSTLAKGTQVDVTDGLQAKRYDLKRVTKLCTPADKSGAPAYLSGPDKGAAKAIEPAAIRNPDDRLICYKATLAKKFIPQNGCGPIDPADQSAIQPPQEKHEKLSGVYASDQLGSGLRNTVREVELCIPSLRTP